MAYRIEDIDWENLPEGATHFAIETTKRDFLWFKIEAEKGEATK